MAVPPYRAGGTRSGLRRALVASLLALAPAAVGQVPVTGAACLPPLGNGNICTANDLEVQLVTVDGPSGCTEGEQVAATVSFIISRNANFLAQRAAKERTSIGFFIGENGEPVIEGASCTFSSLVPLAPPLDLAGGSGGYRDLNGDACGDIDADDVTVHRVTTDQLLCEDSDGDGRLDIDLAVTWAGNPNAQCTDPGDAADFFPAQSSKCLLATAVDLDIPVESPPVITLRKTASPPALPAPGGPVTFTVSLFNASDTTDPVTIDSLVDDVHGNLAGQGSCVLPQTIPAGESYDCAFVAQVSGPAGSVEIDTVTAQGSDDEGVAVEASDTASVSITGGAPPAQPAVALTKQAAPDRLFEPGGPVSYRLVVENTGNVTLEVTGLLDDRYPGGALDGAGSCSTPFQLPAGASYECEFSLPVAGDPGDSVVNTATVVATAGSQVLSQEASATVVIDDRPARLVLRKVPSPAFLPLPGGEVSYRLQLANLSLADTVTVTALVDNLHGDVTDGAVQNSTDCVLPQVLSPGTGYQCTFAADVTGTVAGEVPDTVVATGVDDDGGTVEASAGALVTLEEASVGTPATLAVLKTAVPSTLPEPGGAVTFTATVTNTSSADVLTLTSLVDDVHGDLAGQGNCALPQALAVGASYECSFSAQVFGRGGSQERDTITATATADDDGEVVTAEGSALVTLSADPAVIAVSKRPSTFLAAEGEVVTFTVVVTNQSAARSVELRDLDDDVYGDLDGLGDCSLPRTLAAGAAYRCEFPGAMGPGLTGLRGLGLHRNTVTATGIAPGAIDRSLVPVRATASAFVLVPGFSGTGPAAIPAMPLVGLLLLATLLVALGWRRR
jgi:hypothetical protein